ncbi:hypothetical protein DFO47_101412 [Arthrobacter sp. AG258]|uniref:hypothetical protein n=1 Tax=Arthrobacter sp. AG258 TaxID=2183899 RepID=UPI00105D06D3|nr:hypothetical protein [Arthrobacter sp. AG258]TDT85993.1 hypothetical protein DFO47_101412 [Arthrobacter sp. AG258]
MLTAALLAFTGCSAGQNQPNNEISTIKKDVVKLRGANGLFRMPEASDYESTLDVQAALEIKSTPKKDPVVPNDGSVHATYLASRLLDTSFPDITNERTKQELERVLQIPETDILTRLKALVALKRSGSEAWHNYTPVVGQAQANLPASVTAENLNEYVELIDVLMQADPRTTLSSLKSFDAQPGNDSALSKALIALSNSMYFKNSAEVRSMFPAVQAKLPEIIANQGTGGLNYFRALTAMTSASLSGLDSNDFDSATQKLQNLKGCKEFSSLYRLQTDEASPCSLSLSAALIAVPGAYDLGANK